MGPAAHFQNAGVLEQAEAEVAEHEESDEGEGNRDPDGDGTYAFQAQLPAGAYEAKVAIDQAIRALEGQPVMKFVKPIPDMISADNVSEINMGLVLAPADWTPVYSVTQQ